MASPQPIGTLLIILSVNLLIISHFVSSGHLPCPQAPSKPKPKPEPTPSPSPVPKKCPRDALKLEACANLLGGLVDLTLGRPPKQPCCSLLEGLADVEAAVCLCTAVKAKVLGVNIRAPVDLSLLLNYCGKKLPAGFNCF